MKYILNETPIRTTNGFNINNIELNLDIPTKCMFHDYNISSLDNLNISSSYNNNFESLIGLKHNSYKNTTINLDKSHNKLINVEYEFKDNDDLIDNIDINISENTENNVFINYHTIDNYKHFHNGNININIENNASLNLTILNLFNSESINFLSSTINCKNNSEVIINLIDLSGKIRLYNFKSNAKNKSRSILNNIYVGKKNEIIDLNYHYINEEELSFNNIEVQGILKDDARKSFKGIIDFLENSKKSVGRENENCLLLSNTCVSKSLPILLCHEEDVDGTHSVSSGKIDDNKMFYLMSRGIDEKEAKKIIIKANFNAILNNIPDSLRESISNTIDEII